MPLHHGPNLRDDSESSETIGRNARYGLGLFAVYLALYGAFVGVNAFAPQLMERMLIGGVNLAILAGFGLIVAAFVLALVYGWLCRNSAPTVESSEESRP